VPQLTRIVANNKIMEKTASAQILYDASASLWLLSYSPNVLPSFVESRTIAALVDMCKGTESNKIVRVTLLTMVNLLGSAVDSSTGKVSMNELMIEAGAMGLLDELPLRHWQNYDSEDVASDITMIRNKLKHDFRYFSSFERYKRELEKGNLLKGPLHTVEFWKENWSRFDCDSFGLIRKLVQIIQTTPAFPIMVRRLFVCLFVCLFLPWTLRFMKKLCPSPRAAIIDGRRLREAHSGVL
jgi:hypothetical protein